MGIGKKVKHFAKRHLTPKAFADPLVGGAFSLKDKRSPIRKAFRSVKNRKNWRSNLSKYIGGGSRSASVSTVVPASNASSYRYQLRPLSGLM